MKMGPLVVVLVAAGISIGATGYAAGLSRTPATPANQSPDVPPAGALSTSTGDWMAEMHASMPPELQRKCRELHERAGMMDGGAGMMGGGSDSGMMGGGSDSGMMGGGSDSGMMGGDSAYHAAHHPPSPS